MNISVLLNPEAAAGRALRLLPRIKQRLAATPHDFGWTIAKTAEELRRGISGARASGADAVLLVGGDGTVHEALPALVEADLPFGLVPCGRGNDFARNIDLPADLNRSCRFDANPPIDCADLARVNNRPFGSIGCLGFDAAVNRLAKERRGYFGGSLGYIMCVFRALGSFTPFEVQLRIDDQCWEGRVMMVAVANGPFYGGGMKIAPDADMHDGSLDVCVIKEVAKLKLLRNFPQVFLGKHTNHAEVVMMRGSRVEISSSEPREIFADGEPVCETPASFSIADQKLRVLRPATEPAQRGVR